MRARPEKLVGESTSREHMANFLDALSNDAMERGAESENLYIFDTLESMGVRGFATPPITRRSRTRTSRRSSGDSSPS